MTFLAALAWDLYLEDEYGDRGLRGCWQMFLDVIAEIRPFKACAQPIGGEIESSK